MPQEANAYVVMLDHHSLWSKWVFRKYIIGLGSKLTKGKGGWVSKWESVRVWERGGDGSGREKWMREMRLFLPFSPLYISPQNNPPLPSVHQYLCFTSHQTSIGMVLSTFLTSHATTQAWLGTFFGQKVKIIMNIYFKVCVHTHTHIIYGSIHIHVFVRLLTSIYTFPSRIILYQLSFS